MSNEMKDYLYDKISEVVLDSGRIDKIEEICSAAYSARNYVHGWKDGHKVILIVWFDDDEGWKLEEYNS